MDNFVFNPADGFANTTSYPDPASGSAARNQLQSLHTQTREYINTQIVTAINSINSSLATIQNALGTDEGNITALQNAIAAFATSFTTSGLKIVSNGVTYDISVDGGGNVIATPEA